MARIPPDFSREADALLQGALWVVGADEVGRGPLAGPVTAAAVRLDPARIPAGLADSKVLSDRQRTRIAADIHAAAEVCIAHATVEEIDALNILQASMLAMRRAIAGLPRADFALIDGNRVPEGLPCGARAVVKGDAVCLSIAAASIVAKVARDRIMVDLAQQYPPYGWHANMGYPTKLHLQALLDFGVTPWHRRSFRPIHNILYQDI
jgi:ribonuclease HII